MRILVAMSGGVDSSVVASRLAEQGHEVIGATLQLYDQRGDDARKGACCAGRDIQDARRVAERIGFAHYVIDAEARFRESVIDSFAASYAAGETPVPCVQCNRGVKFTDLLGLARDLGAEAMATGHYVRRFPLGEMAGKDAVRAEAARLGLAVADKPDSQDLCFVPGQGSYSDMVERLRPDTAGEGEIVDREGTVLGRHQGIARYTTGQTKRLGEAAMVGGARQQVVRIEPGSRRIVVAPRTDAGRRSLRLRDMNWLVTPPREAPLRCGVQLRAREMVRAASVTATPDGAEVRLDQEALPAPGQACVLYDGARVLGGGFIRRHEAA